MNTKTLLLSMIVAASASAANAQKRGGDASFLGEWRAERVVSEADVEAAGLSNCFRIDTISDAVFGRMWRKTWKDNCTLRRSDLRHLRLLHRNAEGRPQLGEMIVNKAIAERTVRIFRKLYARGYRIERMRLVDDYNGDDNASMAANNTSCFNFRLVAGSTKRVSLHGRGLAIDLNPKYNPHVRRAANGKWKVSPEAGRRYAFNRERRNDIPFKISPDDEVCRLFRAEGFTWGGSWRHSKDYQHFEYAR